MEVHYYNYLSFYVHLILLLIKYWYREILSSYLHLQSLKKKKKSILIPVNRIQLDQKAAKQRPEYFCGKEVVPLSEYVSVCLCVSVGEGVENWD